MSWKEWLQNHCPYNWTLTQIILTIQEYVNVSDNAITEEYNRLTKFN